MASLDTAQKDYSPLVTRENNGRARNSTESFHDNKGTKRNCFSNLPNTFRALQTIQMRNSFSGRKVFGRFEKHTPSCGKFFKDFWASTPVIWRTDEAKDLKTQCFWLLNSYYRKQSQRLWTLSFGWNITGHQPADQPMQLKHKQSSTKTVSPSQFALFILGPRSSLRADVSYFLKQKIWEPSVHRLPTQETCWIFHLFFINESGQRRNLSPRRQSNPWLSLHWRDALTTDLLGDTWGGRSYLLGSLSHASGLRRFAIVFWPWSVSFEVKTSHRR